MGVKEQKLRERSAVENPLVQRDDHVFCLFVGLLYPWVLLRTKPLTDSLLMSTPQKLVLRLGYDWQYFRTERSPINVLRKIPCYYVWFRVSNLFDFSISPPVFFCVVHPQQLIRHSRCRLYKDSLTDLFEGLNLCCL